MSVFKDIIYDVIDDYVAKVPLWPHDVRVMLIAEKFQMKKSEVELIIREWLEK